jgi:hypothetical protein
MLSPAMLWGGGNPKLISIIGKGLLAYTNDLKNWVQVDLSSSVDSAGRGVAYNSTNDVLMMSNLGVVGNFPQQVRKTKLGTFKNKSSYSNALPASGYNPSAGKLTYDYGKWLYGDVNSRVALSSNDGLNWTNFNTWGSSATRNPSIVRYFNSAARYTTCYPNVSPIGVSPSGSFNSATWSVTATGFTSQTRFIAEGTAGNFLALGGSTTVGQIATSTNLTTWTSRTWITGTPLPNWAVWNGTTWVIVANGGNIATSTDAISWTSRTSGVAVNLLWVDWDSNNNQFIAVGNDMAILTSTDGIDWTNKQAVTTNFSTPTVPIQTIRVS